MPFGPVPVASVLVKNVDAAILAGEPGLFANGKSTQTLASNAFLLPKTACSTISALHSNNLGKSTDAMGEVFLI